MLIFWSVTLNCTSKIIFCKKKRAKVTGNIERNKGCMKIKIKWLLKTFPSPAVRNDFFLDRFRNFLRDKLDPFMASFEVILVRISQSYLYAPNYKIISLYFSFNLKRQLSSIVLKTSGAQSKETAPSHLSSPLFSVLAACLWLLSVHVVSALP